MKKLCALQERSARIPRPLLRSVIRLAGLIFVVGVFGLLFNSQPEISIDSTVAKMTQTSVFQSPYFVPEIERNEANSSSEKEEGDAVRLRECNRLEWSAPPSDAMLQRFQAVPRSDAFIRAAFFDKRLASPNITVLGLATMQTHGLFCLLKYPDSDVTLSVHADIEVIPEAIPPFCKWKAAIFTCVNPNPQNQPEYVAVARSVCASPQARLPLEVIEPIEAPTQKFGVCMQALFNYRTEDVGYLIEHFETSKMLGAEQIFVYGVYNVTKVVKSVLTHYVREGTLTIVPWDLPVNSLTKMQLQDPNFNLPPNTDPKDKTFAANPSCVRQYGHYVANIYCMYTNMNFKYLLYTDVDEYIVPQRHSSWHDLFNHLENQAGFEGYASLLFREAQFCDPKEKDEASSMYFHTTAYKRLADVKPASKSPKPAVRPKRVTRVHVNTAKACLPGYFREMVVDPSLARKHVYKSARFCRDKVVQDKTMEKFKPLLSPKINRVANEAGVP